jgi:Tfp pilus assembly protein PilO
MSARRMPESLVVHVGGALALAALGVAWFLVGVRPLMNERERAARLADDARLAHESVQTLVQRRDTRRDARDRVERDLAAMTVRLRPAAAVNAQLAELTRLAERHRLRVDSIEPGAPQDTPLAVRVPLRLAGRGASPDAVRFLADLRARFPDIAVDAFEMTAGTGEVDAAIRFDCVWYADRSGERRAVADETR